LIGCEENAEQEVRAWSVPSQSEEDTITVDSYFMLLNVSNNAQRVLLLVVKTLSHKSK